MIPTAISANRTIRRKVKNYRKNLDQVVVDTRPLTVPNIQGDSFQAPQHPRKPMMVMMAPMPRRTYVPR